MRARRRRFMGSVSAGFVAIWALVMVGQSPAQAATSGSATTSSATLVGASSPDWTWFDDAIGPLDIYRIFDVGGFHYATWQDTPAYQKHPNATAFDYSFDVLPQRLTNPADPINAQIRSFLATTPKNLIITDYHEPDNEKGQFTPAQFRAGILALSAMVRDQNALDGGTRRTSVILMAITFTGAWSTTADDWWPNDARDGGHVDVIEGDMYQFPHATNTPGVPKGYTDGVKWRSASALLSPLRDFARAHNTPWAIAELGILEDVNNPGRRAAELAGAVAFARDNGALHICYFDNLGGRADWKLRWSTPAGTASKQSAAATTWKSLAASTGVSNPPPKTSQEWVLNQGFDNGSTSGWGSFSGPTTLATTQPSGNWLLAIGNRAPAAKDVGACNSAPYWVSSTVAGTKYSATVKAMPTTAGAPVQVVLREVTSGGAQVRFVKSPVVTLTDTTSLTALPTVELTAVNAGDSIRMCLVAVGLAPGQTVYADDFSLSSPV